MKHDVTLPHQPRIEIVRKSDIFDKVDKGILFDIYYDTETTDLNKRFAEITQFGGLITDLAGNILHEVDLRARVSDYTVISPYAWLVQRLKLEDLKSGLPRALFMGKVNHFFELTNHLNDAPFTDQFLSLCRAGKYTNERGEIERYHSYPVMNDDGTIDWDFLRIHENLKKFYFNDPRIGRWVKRDIKSLSIGYNNINADDQWLWTAGHMAGAPNIFMTHLSQRGKFRLDALRAIEAAILAGKAGENRLRAGETYNSHTGQTHRSYSLGSILKANTRHESEFRDIIEGITREDGSFIDLNQLHGALTDSYALLALMKYVRRVHPDILRQMEMNADWKDVVDRMTDVQKNFGNNPALAFIDKKYPLMDGKIITLIGTDQFRNAPKVAVVWNLAIDPQSYTFNGKRIEQLSAQEWQIILKEARENPNAPLKVIHAHKSPRILNEETGYEAGFNLGSDRNVIHDRIRYLAKSRITDAVMEGLRLAYPRKFGVDRLILPQPEEELFTFTTLELFDREQGDDVQVHHRIQNRVEDIAQKSRNRAMQIKSLWLKAAFCDEDIFVKDKGDPLEFTDKIKDINKQLKKLGSYQIPQSDTPVIDYQSALLYKIKILFTARNYFASGALQDIGHHFWFEDQDGIRYSDEDIKSWNDFEFDDAIKTGSLNIRHEIVNTTPLVLDRMIEELGFGSILGADIGAQLDAYKTLRVAGLPHLHGEGDRWYTYAQAQKDVAKIENNEVMDADLTAIENYIPGAWEKFMEKNHESLALLAEYKIYLSSLAARAHLSADQMADVGIDPATSYPQSNFDFPVMKENAFILNVPDRYFDAPAIDPVTNRPLWILPLSQGFNKAAKEGADILLKAEHTGRIYHLPAAKKIAVPPENGIYTEFYKAVRNLYAQSDVPFEGQDHLAVIGSGPYPLFNLRAIHDQAQSLHIPHTMFEGLAAPSLAGYKQKPSGILIYDDNLRLSQGAVRIREVKDNEDVSGWEYETDIIQLRRLNFADIQNFDVAAIGKFGFDTKEQIEDHVVKLMANQKKDPRDQKNTILAVEFAPINVHDPERGMMFYKPEMQIISSVINQNSYEGPR